MQPYNEYQQYDQSQTPIGLDNLPDQMKPIAQKHTKTSNLDILLNKYFNNGELTDIEIQQLDQHQKIILEEVKRKTESKNKRPDQYQKLFFKKAFKYAENAFFKKNKKNRSRRMSQFYHHHFDSVVKKLNISITNFYHPDKKTKPGLTTGQKSFNSSYIKMVLKSLSFRKVCMEYHETFRQDCRKQRNKKISTFSSSLCGIMNKTKEDRTKLIRFMQSSKCKIPWSDREIEEAYKRAGEELDDFEVQDESKKIMKKETHEERNKKIKEKETSKVFDFFTLNEVEYGQLQSLNEKNVTYYDLSEDIQLLQHRDEQSQKCKSKESTDAELKQTGGLTQEKILSFIDEKLEVSCSQEVQSESGSVLRLFLDDMKF